LKEYLPEEYSVKMINRRLIAGRNMARNKCSSLEIGEGYKKKESY
jgi:hypothetical protein